MKGKKINDNGIPFIQKTHETPILNPDHLRMFLN
jgi:hypothetical protein